MPERASQEVSLILVSHTPNFEERFGGSYEI